jgi:hypothetical protein
MVRKPNLYSRPNCRKRWYCLILNPSHQYLDTISFYSCSTCRTYCCFKCRNLAHRNLSCEQYRMSLITQQHSGEEAASHRWMSKYTKTCGSCGRLCEKISGCDHITCPLGSGGCGAEWCWECGANYPEIRRVGNTAHQRSCKYYA